MSEDLSELEVVHLAYDALIMGELVDRDKAKRGTVIGATHCFVCVRYHGQSTGQMVPPEQLMSVEDFEEEFGCLED